MRIENFANFAPMKKFLALSLLAVLAAALPAGAVNVLRVASAVIEAPEGMAYDRDLSLSMGLDVFRTPDSSSIFAIGAESITPELSLPAFVTALSATMGSGAAAAPLVRIDADGGRLPVYVAGNSSGRRTFAVAEDRDAAQMVVVMILGDIPRESTFGYIRSLRIRRR